MAEGKESIEDVGEGRNAGNSIFKWVLLIVLVVFFGVGGYVGWALSVKGVGVTEVIPENPFKGKEEQSIICPVDSFIANLMDRAGLGKRYLKVTMKLEVGSDEDRDLLEEHTPQIRDTVLLLLSSLTFKEINSMEGKLELKQSLISRINDVLGGDRVKKVYFSEFVVQ
jgi:flagellar FliL protein